MTLVRQLRPARRHCIAKAAQVTGVAVWIFGGLFAVFVMREYVRCCIAGESRYDVARMAEAEMVHTGYARWLATHPGEHCPPDLDALQPYLDHKDTKDPWGERYVMTCAPATGPLIISSSGEDGRFGTPDDIRSDN